MLHCLAQGGRIQHTWHDNRIVDVDCWTEVRGQPIKPGTMCRVIREKLNPVKSKAIPS